MLTRRDLFLHPTLQRLSILRFAQGSNFPLDSAHALQLSELWGEGPDSDALDAEAAYTTPEGAIHLRLHRLRERSRALVLEAKRLFVERHGRLFCELCGFDFERMYGPVGAGYIEAHHAKPLASLQEGGETSVADLKMVCSNCHRVIHRGDPSQMFSDLKRQFANE
jgi:predicted HNH restriction endonuclease